MKGKLGVVFASTLLVGVFAWNASAATPDAKKPPAGDAGRIQVGFQIAPVPLAIASRHLDPNLVGLGSYIVNAQAACNDCHTNPPFAEGHDPFQGQPEKVNVDGYLAGGTAFGPFVSRNITPDDENRPAGLTFEQFKQVIRTGHDPDNEHPQLGPLLQVMPWPIYKNMTDADLRAVYEYLRSIPSLGDHDD